MTVSDFAAFRKQLITDEGLRLFPYTDTRGRLTIGFGRNLTDSGISQSEAADMLTNDMTKAASDLQQTFPFVMTLDSTRFIVLACMVFNMGIGRLANFAKMWTAVRASDWQQAAEEMLNSEWAEQVGARATRLAASMASGELK